MSITIDDETFQIVFERIARNMVPSSREVTAIVQLVELVAGADFRDDPGERDAVESLIEHFAHLTGMEPARILRLGQLPSDAFERRPMAAGMASRISTKESRELAFALSYLVIVTDFELAPAEIEALDDVQHALGIDDDRATELTVTVAELVTPGIAVHEEPRHAF